MRLFAAILLLTGSYPAHAGAHPEAVERSLAFLVNDCCGGRPELCQPLVDAFTPSCNPKEAGNACC